MQELFLRLKIAENRIKAILGYCYKKRTNIRASGGSTKVGATMSYSLPPPPPVNSLAPPQVLLPQPPPPPVLLMFSVIMVF